MRGVDLFCGCGGLSLGFMRAGATIAAAYDNWEAALACYRRNFSHPACAADLADADAVSTRIAAMRPRADFIAGGPPCQDFSSAGKRMEKERANLTQRFADIVARVRPRWFVMENVARARCSQTYRLARETFKGAGYGLTEAVLNASHYGVPQNRSRFFCVGLDGAEDGFLAADLTAGKANSPMTIRDYFAAVGEAIDVEHYYRHPRSYRRRGVFSIDEPSPTIRGVNRPVPDGYLGHGGDTVDARRTRPLSTRERALIQTFPKEFILPDGKSAAEQALGNAVPVKLAEFIAAAVLAWDEKLAARMRDLAFSRRGRVGLSAELRRRA